MPATYGPRRIRFNWRGFIPPGVKLLVLICSGVYFVQLLIGIFLDPSVSAWMYHFFGLVPLGPIPGLRLWQPITYIFLHGSFLHLLFNMLFLWMFGKELELTWGKQRFLNYFFLCGIGAGLIELTVKLIPMVWGHRPSDIPTIGASGAIFGILMANAVLFPERQVWIFPFPIAIPMRPYVAVIAAIEFISTLGVGGDAVSHLCHLGGLLVGWLYLRRGSFLYNVRNSVSDWRLQRNRKKFEVFMGKHKNEPPSRPDSWIN
ncbi:MAG TPA: rhomboid family intramembrane serine protease [Candidatus Acidoferrum sp.]|nr:rhomboid family intramembrane serine protease [Candidatus Acidoferrum sp.]